MATTADLELTPDRVFREYAPRVYNLARRMLGNDSDAEDVTQDVLLQVVRKLDTFRGEAAFPTWLPPSQKGTARGRPCSRSFR
jgi:RNA polymerase sigma-70 factor (ECF subfamily)